MTIYRVEDLRFRFGDAEILRGISLEFQLAQMVAIVGPNGAGKSTLMSVLSGFRDEKRNRAAGEMKSPWGTR